MKALRVKGHALTAVEKGYDYTHYGCTCGQSYKVLLHAARKLHEDHKLAVLKEREDALWRKYRSKRTL